ncbi:hypothetical protein D3C80_568760 [compost metagenome]
MYGSYDPIKDNVAAPFRGRKISGLGCELGQDGIHPYTDVRHVHMQFKPTEQIG